MNALAPFSSCTRCRGTGRYKDPACKADKCAHGPKALSKREQRQRKDAELPALKTLPRRMRCPRRPCDCKAGARALARLKTEAREQFEEFPVMLVWACGHCGFVDTVEGDLFCPGDFDACDSCGKQAIVEERACVSRGSE